MNEMIKTKIEKLLDENKVMLFMKGNPNFPQCGFSARAVAILREHNIEFSSFDVLEDEDIRQGIKDYGQWPTIPQLYYKKQLVGGSDILMEMHEANEIQQALTE